MSGLALGIDVGGSKIAGVLVDLATGAIRSRAILATEAHEGGTAVAGRIAALVTELRPAAQEGLCGIGIGLPELVGRDGRVASAFNFDLTGVDWAMLAPGLAVRLDSDVRCGARAEMAFGAGRRFRNFSYLSIGTGISAAQVIGGRVHCGVNGYAIHFGSSDLLQFSADGHETRFNLETAASGGGLARSLGADASISRALAGDDGPVPERIARSAIRAMASYLGQMVNMLDPAAVVIGGGLGLAPGYIPLLAETLPEFIWADSCRGLPVLPAALGRDAGAVGAAALWAEAGDRSGRARPNEIRGVTYET